MVRPMLPPILCKFSGTYIIFFWFIEVIFFTATETVNMTNLYSWETLVILILKHCCLLPFLQASWFCFLSLSPYSSLLFSLPYLVLINCSFLMHSDLTFIFLNPSKPRCLRISRDFAKWKQCRKTVMLTFNDYLSAMLTQYEYLNGKKIYSRQYQDEIQMTNMHLKNLSGLPGIKEMLL